MYIIFRTHTHYTHTHTHTHTHTDLLPHCKLKISEVENALNTPNLPNIVT